MNDQAARIIGTGSYLPERVLTNFDLEKMVETTDEWIVARTGMQERRIAREDEFTSMMGIEAAKKAMASADIGPEKIDYILVATLTPDYIFPSTACLIQEALGAKNAASMDMQAACTGYLYALSMAKALVQSGTYDNILVVAAEKLSCITDYTDRSTCILFGDGAAASIVSSSRRPGLAMTSICLGSDGEYAQLIMQPGGGSRCPASLHSVSERQHYIKMSGNEVFKHAVRRMEAACKECLDEAGILEEQVSWLVPHQANARIIDALAKRFHHLPATRIYKTLHKYGNTSASSIGIALDELLASHVVEKGENILLTAFGAGLTWGAALFTSECKS